MRISGHPGNALLAAILADHPGPVDSIRTLRLLDKGFFDYTATRQNQPD